MATYQDAAKGWRIYRDRDGQVSRPQLNAALGAIGRRPISDRTYKHYGKLFSLGYHDYVSINRLDLRHSNVSVFDVADRSRYQDRSYDSPATLVVPRGHTRDVLAGQIITVSEGFALLRLPKTAEAERAANATIYKLGILRFEQVEVERAVAVAEGRTTTDSVDLLLEFRGLLETDLFVDQSAYAEDSLTMRLNLGPDAAFANVITVLHRAFDLAESMRGFSDLLVSSTGANGIEYSTPSPRVRHLEFSNPLELIIAGAVIVTIGITTIVNRVSNAIGNVADTAGKVDTVGRARSEEQRQQELHTLKVKSLQLDNLKKQVEVNELIALLRPEVEEVAGRPIPSPDAPTQAKLTALKDQAVEASTELWLSSSKPIETETGDRLQGH